MVLNKSGKTNKLWYEIKDKTAFYTNNNTK